MLNGKPVWLNTANDRIGPHYPHRTTKDRKGPTKDRKGALELSCRKLAPIELNGALYSTARQDFSHAAELSWKPALSDSQSVCRGRPRHLWMWKFKISFFVSIIRSIGSPSLTGRRCQSRSGSASGMLCSRWHAKALLARSNQHLLMAAWPSCTVQMLGRNWEVVVDQGPTARRHKTRSKNFD